MSPFMLFLVVVLCGALVLIVDLGCDVRRWTDPEAPHAPHDGATGDRRAYRHEDPRR